MIMHQIEKNLLVFLDPAQRWNDDAWRCISPGTLRDADARFKAIRHQNKNLIFSFQRHDLPGYLFCCLTAWLEARQHKRTVRKVLYLNDGLLSSVFATNNVSGYRAFARNHLPHPDGLRRQLVRFIPPFWRAEQRFVAIESIKTPETTDQTNDLAACDYLFFSNYRGKLMLTQATTFSSGNGLIFKTAATPGYAASLQHEQSVVQEITKLLQQPGHLLGPQEKLSTGRRTCFSEAYLAGKNLREVLRLLGKKRTYLDVCQLLDRLDTWFNVYCSAFTNQKQKISALYEPMLQSFSELYDDDPDSMTTLQKARELLEQLDLDNKEVIPITAHNDLWPGNFILHGEQLTAIDWERATGQSPPFFDYFWMIIAAVLEYYVGQSGVQDYSLAFRKFLRQQDQVSIHAHHKLEEFLYQHGLGSQTLASFMLLFLMEWSIQGFKTLGKRTDMDLLAHGELAAFAVPAKEPLQPIDTQQADFYNTRVEFGVIRPNL